MITRRAGLPSKWLVLGLLALTACAPEGHGPRQTIEAYLEAVQVEDMDALFCLSAGAPEAPELGQDVAARREGFESWARAQYDLYLRGREGGWIDLDGEPIPLVKLFALGRGAFYTYGPSSETAPGSLRITTTIRFGYPQVDLSRLSPGTTFYLSGMPVGTVHPVQVPSGPREIRLEVLDTVAVDWELTRSEPAGGCEGGYAVASAVPVAGSATSTEVTWVF